MPRTLESALLIGALLILSSPATAQRKSAAGPGIGSASGLRSVPSPQPLVGNTFPFYYVMPPTVVPEQNGREGKESTRPASAPAKLLPPKEPPPEDPRTMITRDRIQSPQH